MVLEKKVAGSRVSRDAELKMMTEDAYLKHATELLTEQEGRLTGSQAASQWLLGLAIVWMVCEVFGSLFILA